MQHIRKEKKCKNTAFGIGTVKADWVRNKGYYLLFIPVFLYFAIFCYAPMVGVIIAFKDYSPGLGILGSPWVGFEHFIEFFQSFYFWRLLGNTLKLSIYGIIFVFPAPIILALLFNELRYKRFMRITQTIVYLPKFISLVVICGLIKQFTYTDGLFNDLLFPIVGERIPFLQDSRYFRFIYTVSDIWQNIGWDSIVYLAALMAVDQELYEAAAMDGAGRWRQLFVITIPSIMPTIVILFILRLAQLLNVGYEKIILLYNDSTYNVADVISTYVYRKGLVDYQWSYSTAIGVFNSVCSIILLFSSNKLCSKATGESLW